jgi:TonB-linked SusC/RagA family outer membrane protein
MARLLFALMVTVLCSMKLLSQTRTITGKVRGEDGLPVANALMIIKGSNTRTTTKADGSYSFLFTRNTGTLVVSSGGYISQELEINPGIISLNIALKRAAGTVLPATVRSDTAKTALPPATLRSDTAKPVSRATTIKSDTPKTVFPPATLSDTAKPVSRTATITSDTAKTVLPPATLRSDTAKTVSRAATITSNTAKTALPAGTLGSDTAKPVSSTTTLQSNTPKTVLPAAALKSDTAKPILRTATLILDTAEIVLRTASIFLDTAEIVFDESDLISDEVFIPYGTARRRTLTGSVGHINDEQFSNRPITNITTVIDGLIPGVTSTSINGQPGAGLNMRVRGFGSINASSEPLLVVDGVPYVGSSSNINPADVESITVLKDAASTALYGSRAGNGVVIITTKKGRRGRNGITLRVMQGITSRGLPEYERLDAFQYYPMMWEAYRNSLIYPISGTGISLDSANRVASGLTARTHIHGLLSYNPFNVANNAIVGTDGQINPSAQLLYGDDLDWTKELFRKGPRSDYSVNFNGGSEQSDYFLSLGYVNENGYIRKSDFERYSARLNVNIQPVDWLKTGLNISANRSESNIAQDTGSTSLANPFYFTRNIGPIYPVHAHNITTGEYLVDQASGRKFWDLGNMGGTSGIPNRTSGAFAGRHALGESLLDEELLLTTAVSARSYQQITFLKNFRFTNNLSVDYQIQDYTSYDNPLVGDGAPLGQSRKLNASSFAFVASQLLNYEKAFDVHRLDVLVGHESYNQKNTNLNGFRRGQTVSGSVELGNFSTINSTASFVDRYKIESYFSRLNYDFDGKYFFSASLRRDGNSLFSPASRWGNFWSVGAGWDLSNEDLMSDIRWINLLKLRGSYGVTGVSDGTGATTSFGFYAYQGLYNFSNNANEPGIVQSQTQTLISSNLKWEENKQMNVGIDFSLFRNRLRGSVDYFQRTSSDLLFAVPQPLSSGVLTVIQNTVAMKNKGVELQLGAAIIRSKSFTWNTTVNLSTLTNEITAMPGNVPEFIAGTKRYAAGQSVLDYWLPTYYGVDSADGAALYKAANTAIVANRRIKNNKSGGSDTLTILASNALFEYQGTSIPDFYGSLSQSFTYKGFTLTALFTFQLGGKTYDANYQGLMSSGTYGAALSTDILDRWQKPGDNTDVPRLDAGRTTDFNATSSRWLVDASFVNIRMASLAYELPASFISRRNLSTARFFVSGENLGFFSKRKGLNNQQDFGGVTSNSYPPATIISAGIILNR